METMDLVQLICNVDLDSIAASEQPADAAFVAKHSKVIGELLYLSVNTLPDLSKKTLAKRFDIGTGLYCRLVIF
jgi:hypothetical protein